MSYLKRVVGVICVAALLLSTGLLFLNILLRELFNASYPWAEEAVRYLFAVITFIGLSLGVTEKADISVDVFLKIIKKSWQKKLLVLVNIIELVALASLGVLSFMFALNIMTTLQTSPILGIPIEYLYFLITIGVIPRVAFGIGKFCNVLKNGTPD